MNEHIGLAPEQFALVQQLPLDDGMHVPEQQLLPVGHVVPGHVGQGDLKQVKVELQLPVTSPNPGQLHVQLFVPEGEQETTPQLPATAFASKYIPKVMELTKINIIEILTKRFLFIFIILFFN